MSKSITGLNEDHLHILLDALNCYSTNERMMRMNERDYLKTSEDDSKGKREGTLRLRREAVARIEAAFTTPEAGDGTSQVTLGLTAQQAEALLSTFASAERGREDFNYLAGLNQGDYEEEDVVRAQAQHVREVEVEGLLRGQIEKHAS